MASILPYIARGNNNGSRLAEGVLSGLDIRRQRKLEEARRAMASGEPMRPTTILGRVQQAFNGRDDYRTPGINPNAGVPGRALQSAPAGPSGPMGGAARGSAPAPSGGVLSGPPRTSEAEATIAQYDPEGYRQIQQDRQATRAAQLEALKSRQAEIEEALSGMSGELFRAGTEMSEMGADQRLAYFRENLAPGLRLRGLGQLADQVEADGVIDDADVQALRSAGAAYGGRPEQDAYNTQSRTFMNPQTQQVVRGYYDPRRNAAFMEDGTQVPAGYVEVSGQVTGTPSEFGSLNDSQVGKIQDQEVATKNFIATAGDALSMPVLDPSSYTDTFDRLGIENRRIQGLITSLAFQAAAASGQTGRGVSNRDIERFIGEIGGQASDPRAFRATLMDSVERAARNFRTSYETRTGNPYEGDLGVSRLPGPPAPSGDLPPAVQGVGVTPQEWGAMTEDERAEVMEIVGGLRAD